ncbi:MAG: DUF3850 domain-containing protein [Actinomycetia bacterium]|nr:DUF3850 domain-containing protein [Actinomycetes bacterium]
MAEWTLKIAPPWFDAVASGQKTLELRREDTRRFEPGDVLVLREWRTDLDIPEWRRAVQAAWMEEPDPDRRRARIAAIYAHYESRCYTGRTCRVRVTHVLRHADVPDLLPPGVAALSIRRMEEDGP